MKLYLDTEFNGFGGELISMALVERSAEWYCARVLPAKIDPWVADNVIPKIGIAVIPDVLFRQSLHRFLLEYFNPEIICDWHADAVHFCQWLGGEDFASSLDYACQIKILKTPPGYPPQSANSHNALWDAHALMDWHQKVAA